LDDAEYNIPPVEKPPTLESILNDDESSLISEEELSNYLPQEVRYLSLYSYSSSIKKDLKITDFASLLLSVIQLYN
jgi:hypothetical protein